MGNAMQILPGTGRWQPKADGGVGSCNMDWVMGQTGFYRPLHRCAVPLPVPGRI
jgi:hypothetical protein